MGERVKLCFPAGSQVFCIAKPHIHREQQNLSRLPDRQKQKPGLALLVICIDNLPRLVQVLQEADAEMDGVRRVRGILEGVSAVRGGRRRTG